MRNRHLVKLLAEKGQDTEEVWSSIVTSGGSVQHLDFLNEDEKAVFKTAFEIDQRWLIDLAGDRADLIDQAQSLNVFLPADIHKRDLHQIHFQAWKKGVKSLYYCRSLSLQRAEKAETADAPTPAVESTLPSPTGGRIAAWVAAARAWIAPPMPLPDAEDIETAVLDAPARPPKSEDYDECLSCQ